MKQLSLDDWIAREAIPFSVDSSEHLQRRQSTG